MKSKKKTIMIIFVLVILFVLAVWTVWGNTALKLNTYTVKSKNLPKAFDRYRIAQVSDLHNAEMGRNNEKLLSFIKAAKPQIIAITGDIADSRRTDVEVSLDFVKEAVKIAPCYYVTGNHESRIDELSYLIKEMENMGVAVLRGEKTAAEKDGEKIVIAGIDDPNFSVDYLFGDDAAVTDAGLKQLNLSEDSFTVLLSHRPELFSVYCENGVDLVLSGHAHGGQFRLPFLGGLYAPHQGFLPKYSEGVFTSGRTNMVVSRGIGNSVFPFRFNNRPEVVLVELQREEQ